MVDKVPSTHLRFYLMFVTCLTWYIFERFGGTSVRTTRLKGAAVVIVLETKESMNPHLHLVIVHHVIITRWPIWSRTNFCLLQIGSCVLVYTVTEL